MAAERCQIDHLIEFATGGGETSIANAGLECSSHNRFKHRSKLTRTRIATDRVETTRIEGSQIRPVGQRSRAERRAARTAASPVHPDVDEALRDPTWRVIRLDLTDGEFRLAS